MSRKLKCECGTCKTCLNREYARRAYKADPEKFRLRSREFAAANREAHNARKRAWHAANREREIEKMRAYRDAHREKLRAADRDRYWANPEPARAKSRLWAKNNPVKAADAANRRRSRLAGTVVEKIDRFALYERDGGRCHICGRVVDRNRFSLDHLVPLIDGGDYTYDNLRIAHKSCNSRRGPGRIPAQLLLVGTPDELLAKEKAA